MNPSGVVCNDTCGCPVPCPGGTACRCVGGGRQEGYDHKTCSCGEHCGCNPCACPRGANMDGTERAHCKCGAGCTCMNCTT